MNHNIQVILATAIAVVMATGCGKSSPDATASGINRNVHLSQEPAGAVEVLDARDEAKDGEPIVLVGRLGGGLKPWIEGRAAFLLVDTRILPSCADGEHCEAGCPDCSKEMLAASTMVKFLGDGVLAVFPVDELGSEEKACERALRSVDQAFARTALLNASRRVLDEPTLELDVALHFGEVVYGNVGTPDRLDFTMIGPAVNEAARMEKLTKSLGCAILASDSFQAALEEGRDLLVPVGAHPLSGLSAPRALYRVALDSQSGA